MAITVALLLRSLTPFMVNLVHVCSVDFFYWTPRLQSIRNRNMLALSSFSFFLKTMVLVFFP